jgi:hypothetical protein
MNHKAGIWIDYKKAVVVSASASGVTAKTLESEVGPHTGYSGPQDGEARRNTRTATASILTGTTTRSSLSWGNPRLF